MELRSRAGALGALGATISGAGPAVLFWCRSEQAGSLLEARSTGTTRTARRWCAMADVLSRKRSLIGAVTDGRQSGDESRLAAVVRELRDREAGLEAAAA